MYISEPFSITWINGGPGACGAFSRLHGLDAERSAVRIRMFTARAVSAGQFAPGPFWGEKCWSRTRLAAPMAPASGPSAEDRTATDRPCGRIGGPSGREQRA